MEIIDHVCKGCGARSYKIFQDKIECEYCGSVYLIDNKEPNISIRYPTMTYVASTGCYVPIVGSGYLNKR